MTSNKHQLLHVVLVDDDPMSREFLVSRLHGMYELVTAPAHAGQVTKARGTSVVLLNLSTFGGVSAANIRTWTVAGHRVLALSIQWTSSLLHDALGAGAAGCISKTADIDAVCTAIAAVGAGHMVVSPELLSLYRNAPDASKETATDPGREEAEALMAQLTPRELEVMKYVSDGRSTHEIARLLFVSPATVKSHVSHVLAKLNVKNRVQAVLLVNRLSLPEPAKTRPPLGGPDVPSPPSLQPK